LSFILFFPHLCIYYHDNIILPKEIEMYYNYNANCLIEFYIFSYLIYAHIIAKRNKIDWKNILYWFELFFCKLNSLWHEMHTKWIKYIKTSLRLVYLSFTLFNISFMHIILSKHRKLLSLKTEFFMTQNVHKNKYKYIKTTLQVVYLSFI
jgi:hypothetical protein